MKFYVGQRVRIVKVILFPQLLGRECRIVRLNRSGFHARSGEHYTGHELDFLSPEGLPCVAHAWQLEPITDPGREVVSWSECVWRPEHLRVSEKECQR